jgi:hypothetical protein
MMESIAKAADRYGEDYLDNILRCGSTELVAPLLAFLSKSEISDSLRHVVKISRPALKADIAHYLNVNFGRHPGLVDYAAAKIVDPAAQKWLTQAVEGFASERDFLNRLTVAAGPIYRQVGQERVNAMAENQMRSLELLANSEREGCPAGAVIAFVVDWQSTRPMVNHIALELSLEIPECLLPARADTIALIKQLSAKPSVQRAMAFGSDQALAQQRGLWQLISARHQALLAAG